MGVAEANNPLEYAFGTGACGLHKRRMCWKDNKKNNVLKATSAIRANWALPIVSPLQSDHGAMSRSTAITKYTVPC